MTTPLKIDAIDKAMTHEIASEPETESYYKYKKSLDIWNKLQNCRWAAELKKLEKLQSLYFIFEGNYKELQDHLCQLTKPEFVTKIRNVTESNPKQKIQEETIRYLFNYLSSAISVYNQIKDFGKNNNVPELTGIFKSYQKSTIPNGISAFVRDL